MILSLKILPLGVRRSILLNYLTCHPNTNRARSHR